MPNVHMRGCENSVVLENFYGQLREVSNVAIPDFNSKLGRLSPSDIEQGFSSFMGRYGMGVSKER